MISVVLIIFLFSFIKFVVAIFVVIFFFFFYNCIVPLGIIPVKGGRRQGRQSKRWEDYFREWTGLEFGKSQRAAENSGNWRKLVAKSFVGPQRPWRLRDR